VIINAYIQANRLIRPTGVGKHVLNMTRQLAALPETEIRVICSQRDHEAVISSEQKEFFPTQPLTLLSGSRRRWELAWRSVGWPALDRVTPRADWIYSPAEVYIPSRHTPVAATVHCVHWFESDYPRYSSPDYHRSRTRWRSILNPMLGRATLVFAVSEFLKQKLVDLFNVPAAKIAVIGNGVEPEFFLADNDPRPLQVKGLRPPYLLAVGGLTPRKGAEYLLALAARLEAEQSNLQIVIAGSSDAEYREAASRRTNMLLCDYVGIDVMPRLMRDARALLCLSRHETFGIPVAEAMAAGTPVIASRYAALPEIVGEAGFTVDASSTEAVVAAVNIIDQNDGQRDQFVAAGRTRAQSFRWEACAARARQAMANAS
jgi:glycosyltransferase involved in cell wall biosynthesis